MSNTITFRLINDKNETMEHNYDALDFLEHSKSTDNLYEDIQPECDCQFNESNNHCECEPVFEDFTVNAFKIDNGEWQDIDPHFH